MPRKDEVLPPPVEEEDEEPEEAPPRKKRGRMPVPGASMPVWKKIAAVMAKK